MEAKVLNEKIENKKVLLQKQKSENEEIMKEIV